MTDLKWTPVTIRLGQVKPWQDNPRNAVIFGHGIIRTNKLNPRNASTFGGMTNICEGDVDMSIVVYKCENCGIEFDSNRGNNSRTPKYCSRACAGFKKGIIPHNTGKGTKPTYTHCVECGKAKTTKRGLYFPKCQTCENKSRAKSPVYYACPRCGRPKNGRGRSDRVLCNSCAALDRWVGFKKLFGQECENQDYYGFTESIKKYVRKRQSNLCAFCGQKETRIRHDVHHIDYDKKHSHVNNLIALCRPCHMKTNFNRKYWTEKCQAIIKTLTK